MFLAPLDDRINLWREFRKNLRDVDRATALVATAELWSRAPFVSHYLIPDDPQSWPEPWELLMDDIFCDTTIALGIVYTLALSDFSLDQIFLKIAPEDNLNLVFYGEKVINYELGTLINTSQLPDTINFRYVYNYMDLHLENYV